MIHPLTIPILKSLHILGAVMFLGVGLGSAFYKWRADKSGDPKVIAWCQHEIVLADWLFTTPSAVIMPVTGFWLLHVYQMPWTTPWVFWGIMGYIVTGVLWLPAVYLQIKMRRLADEAVANGTPLTEEFETARRIWVALGIPAFLIAIAIVTIMTAKYVPW